ncbi:MAG: hypothetical protein QOD77_118 [Thermoplasmata archaeon]|jgi:uncharacterized protein YdhG (YjbR/CyaY superfamily)|nr:hypothetical protein [Thermoplasmata archaeon]
MDGVICEKGRHVNCLHAKRKAKAASPVQDYLAGLAPEPRAALEKLQKAILAAAPTAVEGMSYGMPAFKLDGHGIAAFAAFKDHLSFFPMSGTLVATMQADLGGFKTSKGTVQFTLDKPLPAALVKKMVKARIAELRTTGR